ncbi:MAG: DoxX family protein [Thermoplasmatota archaeon]
MIWLVALLSILFVAATVVKFIPKQVAQDAKRWGLPVWFVQLVGVAELVAAGLLWWPPARAWTAWFLAAIMVGAIGMQVRGRRWKEVPHPAVTLALLVWLATTA